MFTGYIYLITNNITKLQYVGKTITTIENRWKSHCADVQRDNNKFHNAIRKHGKENFIWTSLGEHKATTKKELNAILCSEEIRLIAKFDTFKNGYNLTAGGEGSVGFVHSEEAKRIMSETRTGKPTAKKGQPAKNKGIPMQEVQKEKLRRIKRTPEWNKKNSVACKKRVGNKNPFYGKHHTEETKKALRKPKTEQAKLNMSIAQKGLNAKEKHPLWGKHQSEESKLKNKESNIKTHLRSELCLMVLKIL